MRKSEYNKLASDDEKESGKAIHDHKKGKRGDNETTENKDDDDNDDNNSDGDKKTKSSRHRQSARTRTSTNDMDPRTKGGLRH